MEVRVLSSAPKRKANLGVGLFLLVHRSPDQGVQYRVLGWSSFTYTSLLNYLFYQAGWFACVLGAAAGRPWSGFLVAAALVGAHLWLSADRPRDLRRIAIALATGSTVEIVQIAAGTYQFTSGTVYAALPPPWLLIMWAQMATTFDFSLRPIVRRPVAAIGFGALGGPLAFLAGERLGAVTLQRPLAPGLILLSVTWAAALGVLAFAERWDSSGSEGRRRS